MKTLENIQLKRNRIGKNGLDDLRGLLERPSLSVIDLSDNYIEDPNILPEILQNMPKLAVLYLQGNDVCKKIKNYRKTMISSLPNLKYLDDRPVFDEDRRFAEAFSRGGLDEERKERETVKKEKDDAHWRNHEAFREMLRKAKEERIKQKEEEEQKTENDKAPEQAQTNADQT